MNVPANVKTMLAMIPIPLDVQINSNGMKQIASANVEEKGLVQINTIILTKKNANANVLRHMVLLGLL